MYWGFFSVPKHIPAQNIIFFHNRKEFVSYIKKGAVKLPRICIGLNFLRRMYIQSTQSTHTF